GVKIVSEQSEFILTSILGTFWRLKKYPAGGKYQTRVPKDQILHGYPTQASGNAQDSILVRQKKIKLMGTKQVDKEKFKPKAMELGLNGQSTQKRRVLATSTWHTGY
ncbi:MAG: hypothetical protein AAF985_15585, partial [Bacteroidota bacterium]